MQFHRWTSVLYLLKTYAGINKILQIFVAMWNVLTWSALSLFRKNTVECCISFGKGTGRLCGTRGLIFCECLFDIKYRIYCNKYFIY